MPDTRRGVRPDRGPAGSGSPAADKCDWDVVIGRTGGPGALFGTSAIAGAGGDPVGPGRGECRRGDS